MLDRLVLECLEVRAEVAVLKVNGRLTDQIIAEKQIVVPELDLQEWAAGENCLELEHFIDVGLHVVLLVLIAAIMDRITQNYLHVGVGGTI